MAIYYVANAGNDSSTDPTNPATPWKTLDKVNSSSFNPGDSILLNKGDLWRERLIVPSSGSAGGGYITFGAYGSGTNPLIRTSELFDGDNWVDMAVAGKGIWRGSLGYYNYYGMARNNIRETGWSNRGDAVYSSYADFAANAANGFFYYPLSGGTFYFRWDAGNPGDSEIGVRRYSIGVNGKSYIIIDGIDCYGPGGTYDSGAWSTGLIKIYGSSSHITVRNLELRCAMTFGIITGDYSSDQNNTDILYDNLVAHDCSDTGIELNGSGTIQNCKIYDIANLYYETGYDRGGIGCYISTSAGITVQNNEVYNINRSDGGAAPITGTFAADMAIAMASPIGPVKILRNYIHNIHTGAIQAQANYSSGHQVAYNIITYFGDATYTPTSPGKLSGIMLGVGSYGFQNALIANNTLAFGQKALASVEAGLYFSAGYTEGAVQVKNNIFYDNTCCDINIAGGTLTGGTFTNNCYHKSSYTNNWRWTGTNYSTLSAWQTKLTTPVNYGGDAGAITDDPSFINSSGDFSLNSDFQIPSGSPCVNAGVSVGFTTDYGGFSLVGNPDIGAWELSDKIYSRGDYLSLPGNAADLENFYTGADVTAVATNDDTTYVSQAGSSQYAIHEFKNDATGKSSCTVTWDGQSTLGNTTDYPTILEIYNTNTEAWEELDRDTSAAADTDFTLSFPILSGLDNYKDANGLITCRVYQSGISR